MSKKLTRGAFLNLVLKPRHPGKIIAPFQLGESRYVELVYRLPEVHGYTPHKVMDIDDTNLNPTETLHELRQCWDDSNNFWVNDKDAKLSEWLTKKGGKPRSYTVHAPWDEATHRKQPPPS